MSTVHDVLREAIDERVNKARLIRIDIDAALLRIQSYVELGEQNNKELEELLDALECEVDHIERTSA